MTAIEIGGISQSQLDAWLNLYVRSRSRQGPAYWYWTRGERRFTKTPRPRRVRVNGRWRVRRDP